MNVVIVVVCDSGIPNAYVSPKPHVYILCLSVLTIECNAPQAISITLSLPYIISSYYYYYILLNKSTDYDLSLND